MPEEHVIVEAGYDQIAEPYARALAEVRGTGSYFRAFLDRALDRIPEGGLVLDLGCGAGLVSAELAPRARVVALDVSAGQLSLARARAPRAMLVRADLAAVAFRAGVFDTVLAFWSLIHVRRDLHAEVLRRIHVWLRPGGSLVGTLGSGDNPRELAEDYFGAPMYWSHFDAATNRRLVRGAGFRIVQADEIEDGGETPLWIVAEA
ncbi:MAG TPA: class I SAM-dependent methyltransferase [Actinomycetota bacterium]